MDDWIKIENRLPLLNTKVLVYGLRHQGARREVNMAHLHLIRLTNNAVFVSTYGHYYIDVTHWQPMLKPPNNKQ